MPGAARRLVTFFKRLKKGNQRKPPLVRRPSLRYGFPALLAKPGCCGTRATRSDSPRRNPPAWLRYSAADQGDRKAKQHKTALPERGGHPNTGSAHKTSNPPLRRLGFPKIGGRRRGLSERKAPSFAAARFFRKTEGSPKGRCSGVSFCLVTCILDKQNKVTCCRAAPASKHLRAAHTKSIAACNCPNKDL